MWTFAGGMHNFEKLSNCNDLDRYYNFRRNDDFYIIILLLIELKKKTNQNDYGVIFAGNCIKDIFLSL